MPKYFFRDSGFEAEALAVHNSTGNGVILNSPGNDISIYILGVSSHENAILKQDDNNGSVVLNVGAGNYDLPATVKVGDGKALYVTGSGPISVIYHTN